MCPSKRSSQQWRDTAESCSVLVGQCLVREMFLVVGLVRVAATTHLVLFFPSGPPPCRGCGDLKFFFKQMSIFFLKNNNFWKKEKKMEKKCDSWTSILQISYR